MIKPQIWPCCLGTILISNMALKQQHTVLSTLADNRQNLPFLVDSTLWQWNFKYFVLFELFYFIFCFFSFSINTEHFLRNYGTPLKYKQKRDWWQVNQSGQMSQFSPVFGEMTSCAVHFWRHLPILNIWKFKGLTALNIRQMKWQQMTNMQMG